MAWEWQAWRCFDHTRETIEEKGWEFKLDGHGDNGMVPPLVAESTGHCIAFFARDPVGRDGAPRELPLYSLPLAPTVSLAGAG